MRISLIVAMSVMVTLAVASGAQMRAADQHDVALIFAVRAGHEEEALRLLKDGADADAVFGSQLRTVLMDAVTSHSTNVVRCLLDHGAKVDTVDHHGNTALMLAVLSHEKPFVEALLERGANPDVIGDHNSSALMVAAGRGFADIADCLIRRGADVNLQNTSGSTALLLATARKHEAVAKLLRNAGAVVVSPKETLTLADALQVMNEVTLLNRAVEQALMSQKRGEPKAERGDLQWKDLKPFIPPEAPLCTRPGKDPLGTPYQIKPGKGGIEVAPTTFAAIVELIKRTPVPSLRASASGNSRAASPTANKELAERTGKRMQAAQFELIRLSQDMEAAIERGDKNGVAALQKKEAALGAEYQALHMTVAKLSQDASSREPSAHDLAVEAVRAGDVNRIIGSERQTPLAIAVAQNDMALLVHLLFSGVDPNVHAEGSESPLHIAARCPEGNTLTVRLLLEFGADPNSKTRTGDGPLHLAIDKPAIMETLLAYGADPFMKNGKGNTPYMCLHMFYGDSDLSKGVLEKAIGKESAEMQVSALLHEAVRVWDTRRMKKLLEGGANVNLTPPGAKPMIQIAVEANQIEMVQALLNAGAKVNGLDIEPPLLCYAAYRENVALVELLIKQGAPLHERNIEGQTALEVAKKKGNVEIVKALEAAGAGSPTMSAVIQSDPRSAAVIQAALENRLADIKNQKPSLVGLPVVDKIQIDSLSLPVGFMPKVAGLSFERVESGYEGNFMANPSGIFVKSVSVRFVGAGEASVTVDYMCDSAPLNPRIRSQSWNYRVAESESGEVWVVKKATCTSAR